MNREPAVVMVGLHHRAVPVAVLESARRAVEGASVAAVLARGGRGAVGVVTCHRVELYVEGVERRLARPMLEAWCGGHLPTAQPVVLGGEEAARHLLRVAAGLEAAVLGDENVLGQLRGAYRSACRGRQAGPLLHRLFHAAFRAGKRVRAETALGRGGRSVAGEAVLLVSRTLGGLDGRTVLVLGAGEMARTAAGRLAKRGVGRLLISNRSLRRARDLAAATGGEVVPWPWRSRVLRAADAVVVGTAAQEPVLTADELRDAARAAGHLVALDLSLPRNLEPPVGGVPGLTLIDLEGLSVLLEGERERRRGAVAGAEAIVEQEMERWLTWARSRHAGRCRGPGAGKVVAG
ncbi:MAG: glutamyl-tRNA reductase [Acidobacteria bacterium]|nr:glutamyl-tRNA reductase [Acidobacteriota bacterium]